MAERHTLDLAYSRIDYGGRRVRAYPLSWASQDGVPNESQPPPDYSNIHTLVGNKRDRLRPDPWKRGDEEEAFKVCIPRFFFSYATDSSASQTVYVRQNIEPIVYFGNTTSGNLTYTGWVPADGCSGAVASSGVTGLFNPADPSTTFRIWWNQFSTCAGCQADSTLLQIFNNGTCSLDINGSVIAPGGTFSLTPTTDAGCNAGDQSGFVGGTNILVNVL